MITNDVSDYINLLVRNAHIIYDHPYIVTVSKVFLINLFGLDSRRESNFTLCETGCKDVDWIRMAQDMDQWWIL